MNIEAIFDAAGCGMVKFLSSSLAVDPPMGFCRTIKYAGGPDCGGEVGLEVPAGADDLTENQIEQLARLAADIPPPGRSDGG